MVDVTKLTNIFGEKLRVLVAGTDTYYDRGLDTISYIEPKILFNDPSCLQ